MEILCDEIFMNRKPAVVYRTRKGSAFEMQFHLIVVNPFFKKTSVTEITRIDEPIALQESSKQGIALAGAFVNIFWPT